MTFDIDNHSLLALIIGFTSSMALSRFEARRDGAVTEAATIDAFPAAVP
ncbi:hypothetical protein [Reyranella sp.]|nr:hypothetical protein [Reyranella sp.]